MLGLKYLHDICPHTLTPRIDFQIKLLLAGFIFKFVLGFKYLHDVCPHTLTPRIEFQIKLILARSFFR